MSQQELPIYKGGIQHDGKQKSNDELPGSTQYLVGLVAFHKHYDSQCALCYDFLRQFSPFTYGHSNESNT